MSQTLRKTKTELLISPSHQTSSSYIPVINNYIHLVAQAKNLQSLLVHLLILYYI
jgi:hypothetical protein